MHCIATSSKHSGLKHASIAEKLSRPSAGAHWPSSPVGPSSPAGRCRQLAPNARHTASGALGSASWNFATAAKEDTLEFFGTAGRLAFTVFNAEPIRLETASGTDSFAIANPEHVAQPLIQLIVDDLLGRGTCPSTGESARRTSVVMDRVLEDYYGGRTDAFWLRPATWPGRSSTHAQP